MLQSAPALSLLTCASSPTQLRQYLLASPCLAEGRCNLAVYVDSPSAAWAFNRERDKRRGDEWLVWVHQDVILPGDWDRRFAQAIEEASRRIERLAVVGVYGIDRQGAHQGHVLDRGQWLKGEGELPCEASSLDEVLVAVRVDAGLELDPALGFNFYGTDLVLEAEAKGWNAAIVDVPCEHWSDTPREGDAPDAFMARITRDGAAFESKWAHRLPIRTPCFHITQPGDVERFLQQHFSPATDASRP